MQATGRGNARSATIYERINRKLRVRTGAARRGRASSPDRQSQTNRARASGIPLRASSLDIDISIDAQIVRPNDILGPG